MKKKMNINNRNYPTNLKKTSIVICLDGSQKEYLDQASKANLNKNGLSYTRPWMFVMSDGEPTSSHSAWKTASEKCKQAINDKKLMIFPIGIDSASGSEQRLNDISSIPCINMEGAKFNEFFVWLSESLSAVTRSRPGDSVELPDTDPWRHVGI